LRNTPASRPNPPRRRKTVARLRAPKPASPATEAPASAPEEAAQKPGRVRSRRLATKAGDSAAAVDAKRDSGGLRLNFSFAAATPAALFRRAGYRVAGVSDPTPAIDIEPIRSRGGAVIADVSLLTLEKGQAVRIRLNQPQMPSLTATDQASGSETGR